MIEQVAVNALIVGCGAALLALALSLVRSTVGFFDFSLAGVYTLAAYTTHVFLSRALHPAVAIGMALLIAVSGALLVHSILYEPLRRRGATPEVLLIASLSLLLLLQNVLPLFFGDGIIALPGTMFRGDSIHLWSTRVTRVEIVIIALAVSVTGALLATLRYTDLGLKMRALARDRDLSRTYGVRPERVLITTVIAAASLAGAIGILSAFDSDLTPTMGFRAVLLAAVAAVVGGSSSVLGVFVGSLLLAGAQQGVALSLPVQWQDTVVFTCLIVFVLWRPYGIFGHASEKVRS